MLNKNGEKFRREVDMFLLYCGSLTRTPFVFHSGRIFIYLDQAEVMESKHHCFNCRYGKEQVWKAADIRFACGAPNGFESLKRFACWSCFVKQSSCICDRETCPMKVQIVSPLLIARWKRERDERERIWCKIGENWQNQWQRWCNQFQ